GEVATFDLAAACEHWRAVLDQGDVARCSAHIEGDDVAKSAQAASERPGRDAAGRPGQDGGDGPPRGSGKRGHAAVRLHDVLLPGRYAGAGESAVELRD